MKYIVYDTKHKVYNLGQETMTGLNMRSWGYDKSQAEQLTKRRAVKLALSRANCEIQEVKP
jgi:hypothetical protein